MLTSINHSFLPTVLGARTQLGMVVPQLDDALSFWVGLGIGPWVVIESAGSRRFTHRGSPSPIEMSLAFCYSGETQLEIITPTNDAPSPFREFLDEGRQGLHHLGFWPDDFEGSCRALEDHGFRELMTVDLEDGTRNVAYFESPAVVGIYVELAPMTPFRRQYMGAIEAMASDWDGTAPIRRFATREAFVASAAYERALRPA